MKTKGGGDLQEPSKLSNEDCNATRGNIQQASAKDIRKQDSFL